MDIRKAIADTGAVLEGEFFFALKKKGNVANKYINVDPLFTYPATVEALSVLMVRPFQDEFRVIAGPAVGGIPLIYAGAMSIFDNRKIRTVWADKKPDGSFAFERMGFAQAVRGQRVLVLEDIVSTGDSAKATCDLVRAAGGELIGASFIWNRGEVNAGAIGVPRLSSLIEEKVPVWRAEEHEMWGIWPLVEDVGHPEYFPDYPGPRIKLQK